MENSRVSTWAEPVRTEAETIAFGSYYLTDIGDGSTLLVCKWVHEHSSFKAAVRTQRRILWDGKRRSA